LSPEPPAGLRPGAEPGLPEAMDAALRYLGPCARSCREVRDHLARKGFGAGVAAAAEARLIELGILDDVELARSWVDRAVVGRHEAPTRVGSVLAGKGVAADVIAAALAELSAGDEVEAAVAAAASRLRALHGPEPAVRRRLGAFLARRGYDAEVVEEVFARLLGQQGFGDGERGAPGPGGGRPPGDHPYAKIERLA
jgi:SOS response regulatory protein OraA/RecX